MEVIKKAWLWLGPRLSSILPVYPARAGCSDLAEAVMESLRDWKLAKEQFNYADPGLIDYMVYRINAAERRFMALLSLAKAQGVKAWPDNLAEPVKTVNWGSETGD
ncbi:MAG: DUF2508 family protein [Peptococcaceae bacterium]|nr:DUF2508 family protein [Peptococcaceae bacterium]